MPELDLHSRAEETPLREDLEAQAERLRKLDEDFWEGTDQEIRDKIEFYRRECSLLREEIETSGNSNALTRDNPTNLAINATESSISTESSVRSQAFDQQVEILIALPTEALEELPKLRRQVVEAHTKLAPNGLEGFRGARLVLSVSLGLMLVGGLSALLATFSTKTSRSDDKQRLKDSTTEQELNRRAELTGLLLQAAANQPVDASRYGLSPDRFRALRQSVLALVQELPEEQYWEQLAQAAESGYGSQGDPYTLGDHFYALDLAFTLLQPLIDPQPCELDLATWMPELHKQWQAGEGERPGGGVPRLYRSISTVVTDDSGATRLIRLFLARAALAQAAVASTAAQQPDRPRRQLVQAKGSIQSSFFQISGAAMFCLPPPFMAYGYLANTVLEILCGGLESSSSFFDELTAAIERMEQSIEQIKTDLLLNELNRIKNPIKAYNQSLENKWNELPDNQKIDPNKLPDINFFDDPHHGEAEQSLKGRLEQFFNPAAGGLVEAANTAADMWENRLVRDPKGEWSLLMWLLLAYTSYLSCSRQLASTYAIIANLRGQTNHQDLSDPTSTAGYRPNPSILFTGSGDASELSYWTSKHWAQVRSHIKLVKSTYEWPSSSKTARRLSDARLNTNGNQGYYDKIWYVFVDLWRRSELTLSLPAEIYRWCHREVDGYSAGSYYNSRAFAHGWVTSRHTSKETNPIYAADPLLPPSGSKQTPGTQQWLLSWYQDMSNAKKIAWLDEKEELITAKSQQEFLKNFNGIFAIGLYKPKWTYFLLQTIRKQIQAWRLQASVAIDPEKGVAEPPRLHGAAWPTTGELSQILRCLDASLPCSWQAGPDYLNQVLLSIKDRWRDMATSGSDPSHLGWAKGPDNQKLTYWWRDRRNADQQPMPLLPETIALILEVWLAGAIKADGLQKPTRDLGYTRNEGESILRHLKDQNCETAADDGDNKGRLAYQLPTSIGTPQPFNCTDDIDNEKEFYDQNRELVRRAWVSKREQALDLLLAEPFGLKPSSPEPSESEAMAQNWLNGLLDESLNDDLKLQKPSIKITAIQPLPGLAKPTLGAGLWQKGASVQYSYQLRGLSSFQASGNDQVSEESDLSESLILDEKAAASGMAIRVPRDDLLLARQFLLFRTLTAADDPKKQSKQWVGSGHFDPGQLDATVFHDGYPPVPNTLDAANISIEPASKPPKDASHWSVGNKVQYGLRYLDSAGTGKPTEPSPLSASIVINTATCGLRLTIPSDALGVATSVQVLRQILDPNDTVLDKLKPIAVQSFPVSNHPGARVVEVLDGEVPPPPAPIVYSLKMTTKGLELRRSDVATPVWTSQLWGQNQPPMTSCRMQRDGNLVIYDKAMKPYWASNTMEGEGNINSDQVLRLRANGELAIVNSIKDSRIIAILMAAAEPTIPLDRPDVYLRSGEMMLPDQVLSIGNQSPQPIS